MVISGTALLACTLALGAQGESIRWKSAGLEFELGPADLTARRGKERFSVRQDVDLVCGTEEARARQHVDEFRRYVPEERGKVPDEVFDLTESIEVLSVVGPVVAYLERGVPESEPPSIEPTKRMLSRDVRSSQWKPVTILEFFREADLVEALNRDPFIRELLSASPSAGEPRTFDAREQPRHPSRFNASGRPGTKPRGVSIAWQ